MGPTQNIVVVPALALVLASVGVGCSSGDDVSSGGTSSTPATAGSAPGTAGSLPDGCHEAPASTALGMPGGGEIVCDPDGVVGSPPMDPTETTVPVTTTVAPGPDAGVLQGWATGGVDCAEGEACIAMAVIISGTVHATGPGGVEVSAEIDDMGGWGMAVAPGTWSIVVEADRGGCDETTATATAGKVTEVPLRCSAPTP